MQNKSVKKPVIQFLSFKLITAVLMLIIGLSSCTLSDIEKDARTMDNLRIAIQYEEYGEADRLRSELKTDSFAQLVEVEFPGLDLLLEKGRTNPFTTVESITYPKNQAGISALVHTVMVDSLYLDDVESIVLPQLSEQYNDGNSHQIYLHRTQPPELEKIAKKTDRVGLIEVAKKGAFGYIIKLKGNDALLMGIDKNGDYVDF